MSFDGRAYGKKNRPGVIFFCRQISSDANRTQFNRLRFLCENYTVSIVSFGRVSIDAGKKADNISVFPYKRNILKILLPLWVLRVVCRQVRKNSDLNCIYSTYEPGTLLMSFLISKWLRIKWVADLWDDPEKFVFISRINPVRFQQMNITIKKIEFLLAKTILKYADRIIIGIVPRKISCDYGVPTHKVLPVTNGINLDYRFPDVEKKPPGPGQDFVIFYCGTADTVRLEGIRQCFASVVKHIPRLRLVVAGPEIRGGYDWLKEQVNAVGNGIALDIVGSRSYERVLTLIAQSDICICPYPDKLDLGAAYPVKIFDYMIMGKPVVASRLPGIASIVTHDEDALLFEPGDYEKMAEHIIRLYDSESLRRHLSRNAKKNVKKFEWSLIHEKINDFLVLFLAAGTARS
jgi:glycosyltransferase involved in cell wall biosynthesis